MAERGAPVSVRIVPSRGVAVRGDLRTMTRNEARATLGLPPEVSPRERRVLPGRWPGLIPLLKKGAWFMFSGIKPSVEDLGKRLASREVRPIDRDAYRRATALLRDHLTPAQAWDLAEVGFFRVRGSNGTIFRIGVGNYRMTAGLERRHSEPFADFLLTVKLLLETNESEAYWMSCTREIYTAHNAPLDRVESAGWQRTRVEPMSSAVDLRALFQRGTFVEADDRREDR